MSQAVGDDRLPTRFWSYVQVADGGCWRWTGKKTECGYGRYSHERRWRSAHRWAYEALVGPVPAGLQLDHLCRVRDCVNPDHMEPVTARENLLRGDTVTARRAATTHCPSGHEYTPDNTYRDRYNRRYCIACDKAKRKRRTAAEKNARQEARARADSR